MTLYKVFKPSCSFLVDKCKSKNSAAEPPCLTRDPVAQVSFNAINDASTLSILYSPSLKTITSLPPMLSVFPSVNSVIFQQNLSTG